MTSRLTPLKMERSWAFGLVSFRTRSDRTMKYSLTIAALMGAITLGLPLTSLAETLPKAFVCKLSDSRTAVIKDGRLILDKGKDPLAFTLAALDLKKRSAQLIGNNGATNVTMIKGDRGYHFIETTPSGNMAFTTVFLAPANEQRLFAVHSRHMEIVFMPVVSQYYGWCESKS